MKILITGGCGFIGFELAKKLIEKGYDVDIIDNLSIGYEAKNPKVIGANFLGGDIRAMENISDKPYDCIYHLAAFSRVGESYKHQNYTFSTNIDGTKSVLEYAKRNGCKVIFSSSSSIHHSISPYSTSKRIGEELCRFYRDGLKMDVRVARLYNVYGPGELVDSHMAAVIGLWRASIKKGETIKIHGDGKQRRDFTHIDDIVDGLIRIAENDEKHDDVWELGTGKNYSLNEVANMFGVLCEYVDDVKGNYRETLRVNDNAINQLEWHPKDRLKEYIDSL